MSRFLKFPIQMSFSELKTLREKSHPRARLCIEVGGYMRGREKKAAAAKSGPGHSGAFCECVVGGELRGLVPP